jgi:hypothetical protein
MYNANTFFTFINRFPLLLAVLLLGCQPTPSNIDSKDLGEVAELDPLPAMRIANTYCVIKARNVATESDTRPLEAIDLDCPQLQSTLQSQIINTKRIPPEDELKSLGEKTFTDWWQKRQLDSRPYKYGGWQ